MIELKCSVCGITAKGSTDQLIKQGWINVAVSGERGDGVKYRFRVARCCEHLEGLDAELERLILGEPKI